MTGNYTTTIAVAATPQRAFDAINDVAGWWGRITGTTTADAAGGPAVPDRPSWPCP